MNRFITTSLCALVALGSGAAYAQKAPKPPKPPKAPKAPQAPEAPEPPEAPELPEPPDMRGNDCEMGHWDDDDDDKAKRPARTSAKVKGPVSFDIELISADIEITANTKDEVSVSAKNCGPNDLYLEGDGDDFSVEFDPAGSCESPVIVKLPPGSSVDVETVDGSIKLKGTYKKVELAAVSGDVEVEVADDASVEAVNGKVTLKKVNKRARIESVSGDVNLVTTGSAPNISVETVSGGFHWSGVCGKDCRIRIESYQGDVELSFDKSSSFELKYVSYNGKFTDKLGAKAASGKKNVSGVSPTKVSFGKSEGSVRIETYESDLTIKPR